MKYFVAAQALSLTYLLV